MLNICSWTKGLPESQEALEELRESPDLDALEFSNLGPQRQLVKAAHVPDSVHDIHGMPEGFGFARKNFRELVLAADNSIETCGNSLFPAISFHLGGGTTNSDSLETIVGNAKWLAEQMDSYGGKIILFETHPWIGPQIGRNGISEFDRKVQNFPDYIAIVLKKLEQKGPARFKFLFDVGHVIVTSYNLVANKVIKDPMVHVERMIDVTRGKVGQIHYSIPGVRDGLVDDQHWFPSDDEYSSFALDSLRAVATANKNTLGITYEMVKGRTGDEIIWGEPLEHVKLMAQVSRNTRAYIGF